MRDNEIVERIRSEANIVDIVSDYLRLRKTGKNWLGLCPFHDDKKPSFTVEPVRGIYKCFACGKGGNVFTFLMEKIIGHSQKRYVIWQNDMGYQWRKTKRIKIL